MRTEKTRKEELNWDCGLSELISFTKSCRMILGRTTEGKSKKEDLRVLAVGAEEKGFTGQGEVKIAGETTLSARTTTKGR